LHIRLNAFCSLAMSFSGIWNACSLFLQAVNIESRPSMYLLLLPTFSRFNVNFLNQFGRVVDSKDRKVK
jgi:hypothetical protein